MLHVYLDCESQHRLMSCMRMKTLYEDGGYMRICIRTRVMRLMSEHTCTHMRDCTYTGPRDRINQVNQEVTEPSKVTTQSALPPLPTRLVTKHTPLPLCQKVPGMHSPLWMESRVDCFLCRWKRSQGGSGEGMKTNIKCEDCNEALCFTPKRNCFYEFHYM
jgi:hypothetical protein